MRISWKSPLWLVMRSVRVSINLSRVRRQRTGGGTKMLVQMVGLQAGVRDGDEDGCGSMSFFFVYLILPDSWLFFLCCTNDTAVGMVGLGVYGVYLLRYYHVLYCTDFVC